MTASVRRIVIALSSLLPLACQAPANKAEPAEQAQPSKPAEPRKKMLEPPAPESSKPKPSPEVVRKDLLAENLPPVPSLEQLDATVLASGELSFPEGTDELAPRAALALRDGLLLVGQAYHQRRPGTPSQSWRWTGYIPNGGTPQSTRYESGAIRAAIATADGGLLTGTRGLGYDARGWFATVTADGTIAKQVELDTPSATELFDLVPGRADGELVVLGGYVDAQGWLLSLDAAGQLRWEKYISSFGNTQVRALARLASGELLAVGSRAEKFGEAWAARAPSDGGEGPTGDDVTQTKIEMEGADPNRMVRALVDLGEAGYVALATAKLRHLQAHDQLLAIGFDANGELAWSRVIEGARATDVLGARAHAGLAQFIISVPLSDAGELALALLSVPADPSAPVRARQLAQTSGWTSAGFVEGSDELELIGQQPSATGIAWRRLSIAN